MKEELKLYMESLKNPIDTSFQDQIFIQMATEMNRKWEEVLYRKFKEFTGEKLDHTNPEHIKRVYIVVTPDKIEHYMIDDKIALDLYPMDNNLPLRNINESYRITASRNYKEYDK